jgi:chromosome partitioning protein
MQTLAFVNQKGGCGKTTTAVNLAGALARRGERVLLVDLDPQAHATMALSVAVEENEPALGDVLLHGVPLGAIVREAPGGIALLPATLELSEFEEQAGRLVHPERILRQALEEVCDDYDWALIDCSPRADGVLTANALRAADVVVLVVELGAFALQGALKALGILREIAADGVVGESDAAFELRVVGTLYDPRMRLARELLIGAQARFAGRLFDTVIRHHVRLREAAACGLPVHVLDPNGSAALNFDCLAAEVQALRTQSGARPRDRVRAAGRPAFSQLQPTR